MVGQPFLAEGRSRLTGGCPAAVLARGEWVTNEKRLIDRARLRPIDELAASLSPEPGPLAGAVATAAGLVRTATGQARSRSGGTAAGRCAHLSWTA